MLSKLLKYEIKATARMFLPLYAVLLVFATVNKVISVLSTDKWQAPEVIAMTIYSMLFVGIFVMTLVVMIQRFYKNLLSDEGYLMFTLPVMPWKHIVSKLLVSIMWLVASGIAAIISVCINAYDQIFTPQSMQIITNLIREFFEFFGASSALAILEIVIVCIISLASNVLIYASIALGHLFNRHRILASFGAFLVLSTAAQILFALAAFFIPNGIYNISMSGYTPGVTIPDEFAAQFHVVMWFCIIFFGLLSAGYFALTNYILSRRLNLE